MKNKKVRLRLLLTKILATYVMLGGYFSAFAMEGKSSQESEHKRKYEKISKNSDEESDETALEAQDDDEKKSKKIKVVVGDDNQASPPRNKKNTEKNIVEGQDISETRKTPTFLKLNQKLNQRLFSELNDNYEEKNEKHEQGPTKKQCVTDDVSDRTGVSAGDSMVTIEPPFFEPRLEDLSPSWYMGDLKHDLIESVHDEKFFSDIEAKVKKINSQLDEVFKALSKSEDADIKGLDRLLNDFFVLNKLYPKVLTKIVPSQNMYKLLKKYNELIERQLNYFVDRCVDKDSENIKKIEKNKKSLINFSWPNLLKKLQGSGRHGAVSYIVQKLSEPKMAEEGTKIENYPQVVSLIESLSNKELAYYLTLSSEQRIDYKKQVAPYTLCFDQITLYETYENMSPFLKKILSLTFGSWKNVLYMAIEEDLDNPVVADILMNIGWESSDSIPLLKKAFGYAVKQKKTAFTAACQEYQKLVSAYSHGLSKKLPQEMIRNIVMFNLMGHESETLHIKDGKNRELSL